MLGIFSGNVARSQTFNYTTSSSEVTITGYTGTGGNVVIPATIGGFPVTKIADSAFSFRTTLTNITIPDSVLQIGQNAFYGCSGLLSATIGSGVTTLPRNAFTECVGLTSVSLGANVKTLGDYAFNNCKKLTSITFPAGFESMGTRAFALCAELTSITFPQSVTAIGSEAFYGCTKLSTVYFQQNTFPTIQFGAFSLITTGAKGYYLATASTAWSGRTINGLSLMALDTQSPVINLIGSNPLEIYKGTTFSDPGATVTDNVDATRTITGSGTVNTATVGIYTLTYTATDAAGNVAVSVTRTVNVGKATPAITAAPTATSIGYGQTLGSSILSGGAASVAGSFAWTTPSTSPNAGTASQSVTFTPSDTASYNTASTTISVTVNKATPPAAISAGSYTYNGSYQGPGVSDVSKGGSTGALTLQYGGSSMAGVQYGPATIPPTEAGNYTLVATVAADANYSQGVASANFNINKATATVNVSGTDQIYDGTPKQVTVNTSPEDLPVTIMYSGSSAAPTLAGDYSVMVTVTSPNYSGAVSGRVLKIAKGTPLLSGITATSITAGQPLSTSTISGTAKNAGGFDVSGIWAFNNASSTPSVGTSDQGATFTPSDSTNYNTAHASVSVTVALDPTGDQDGDELTNAEEVTRGTNPYQKDSDNDGVNDSKEVADGTNPTDANSYNSLSKGLAAYYRFSGNANDSSGNGNNGIPVSPVLAVDRLGAANAAYTFNGTSDRIDLANSTALNMNNGVPFSMSAWIKTDFSDGQRVILAKAAGASGNTPALFVDSEGKLRFDNFEVSEVHSNTTVRTGNWMHVAVTYDGSTFRLYVNGLADGEKAFTGSNESGNSWTFSIGGSLNTSFPSGMFKGSIDEVQFWGRTLSPTEVAGVVQASSAPANRAPVIAGQSTTYDALAEFTAGPTQQSANSRWQYLGGNVSALNLLENWKTTGNEVIENQSQWDGNSGYLNNYPFVQRIDSATGPVPAGSLVIHPSNLEEASRAVAIGWKNTSVGTVAVNFHVNLRLPYGSNDGIDYYLQRGLAGSSRHLSIRSGSLGNGGSVALASDALLEMRPGEMLYLIVDSKNNFYADHTEVSAFTVTVAGGVSLDSISEGVASANNSGTAVTVLTATSSDADSTALKGIAITGVDTSHGSWEYTLNGGNAWNSLSGVSPGSARLLKSDGEHRVRFVPNESFNGNAEIRYRAWDQTSGEDGALADLTGAGGGAWVLVAYGAQASLGGFLTAPSGSFSSSVRSGSAVLPGALEILKNSSELAMTWTASGGSFPSGGTGSYTHGIAFALPNAAAMSFDGSASSPVIYYDGNSYNPLDSSFTVGSSSPDQSLVSVRTLVGSPGMPSQMYLRNKTFGAGYGGVYGLVMNDGSNAQLDYGSVPDSQTFKAVYLDHGAGAAQGQGLVMGGAGGAQNSYVPSTMAMWARLDSLQLLALSGNSSVTGSGNYLLGGISTTYIDVIDFDASGAFSAETAKGTIVVSPAIVAPSVPFAYTIENEKVTIIGYTGTGGAVVIPATIGGLPVTEIGNSAFNEKTSITAITLPNSVSKIGDGAFYHCEYLATVSLGSGVNTIGDWAFGHCYRLKSISIPDSVTSLGNGSLSDCVELESVVLGAQVPNLGRYTFTNDYQLTSITLPASIASIGEQAFSHCRGLAIVNFQQSVPPSVNADSFMDIAILAKGYFLPSAMTAWSSVSISGLTFPQIKTSQTISFGALPNKQVGDPVFQLTGTASSGLAVSYVSSDSNVATVNGNSVTILGVGTTTITASQIGDETYAAALPVQQALVVLASAIEPIPIPLIRLSASPTALSSFDATYLQGSSVQTFTLTAAGVTDGITVTAPEALGFVVSVDGVSFSKTLVLPQPPAGPYSQTIYVKILPYTFPDSGGGMIQIRSGTSQASVTVLGQVLPFSPALNLPATLTYGSRMTLPGAVDARQHVQWAGAVIPDGDPAVGVRNSVDVSGRTASNYNLQVGISIMPNGAAGTGWLGDLKAYLRHEFVDAAGVSIVDETRLLFDRIGTSVDPDGSLAEGLKK